MRKYLLLLSVLTVAGCQSSSGGLLYRKPDRVDDPMYSIEEQKRRGRERLALAEESGTQPFRYGVNPP